MGYRANHADYAVSVDGIVLARNQFVIHASVSYRSQLDEADRERVMQRAQMEMLFAVVGEWERAIRLGARTVRVAVAGDGELDRFFKRWPRILSRSENDEDAPRTVERRRRIRGSVRSIASA